MMALDPSIKGRIQILGSEVGGVGRRGGATGRGDGGRGKRSRHTKR